METVLITGGCGFVGRHFACKFLEMGMQVTIVDNLSTGLHFSKWPFPPAIHHQNRLLVYYEDVRDFFKSHVLRQHWDLIVHCAAVVEGRETIENDPLKVAIDLSIDAELFGWLARAQHKPRRVIYFSSSAAYPLSRQQEFNHWDLAENMIDFRNYNIGRPDLTYGWSKLTGEYLAKLAVEKYDVPVVIYRPFGGYGEDQALSYPFPAIVQRVGRRERPVMVWGNGRQARDFIHIDDVIECVLASFAKLQPGEALNVGTGVATTMIQLAVRACRGLGHDVEIIADSSKPMGVAYRVADITKMARLYWPKVSLEEGIRRCHEYQKVHGMLDVSAEAV